MSNAASRFASTFERCSRSFTFIQCQNQYLNAFYRLKGVEDDAAIGLQAAGGLHHLMANHWQILVRSIQRKSYCIWADATGLQSMTMFTGFEDPLRIELEQYKRTVSVRV
jgi:hypothetical protein